MPLLLATAGYAQTKPDPCQGGELKPKTTLNISAVGAGPGESQPDLLISGRCIVKLTGDYFYSKVNITNGGVLIFQEGPSSDLDKVTNFWARSIIVENGGTMKAGIDDKPYGSNLHTLNIILYGKDLSAGHPEKTAAGGDTCVQEHCGIPKTLWDTNGSGDKPTLDNGVQDYFYQYGQMYGTATGYFGYKVLAVGYGGTLQLYGLKGTTAGAAADKDYKDKKATEDQWKTNTGSSWRRLAGGDKAGEDLKAGGYTLTLDRGVNGDWQAGDRIVITTTDYLPSHSEERTIDTVSATTIHFTEPVRWDHVGHRYDLSVLKNAGDGFKKAFPSQTPPTSAETRAAVALLTRSIRIVSGGDVAGDYFECPANLVPKELSHDKTKNIPAAKENCATQRDSNYSFGAHTVFRQGFAKLQVQGVEFHQMGQGGRISHYPVHFHMARQVPPDTYIKDSSVSESMTRWYVLHSTLGVTLQRNVGWKSIGHGYYLEDGTETDNKFYSNIGIYARGAVEGPDNPRKIPGILAENGRDDAYIYRSDVVYPAVFWITNGWNDFVGNMAAGAGTCGICFWFLSAENTDMVEVPPNSMDHMKWSGYSGRQTSGQSGTTPVKLFYKNYCSTAMHSLNTTSNGISDCNAVHALDEKNQPWLIAPIASIAPGPEASGKDADERTKIRHQMDMYYPKNKEGTRSPSVCADGSTNCDLSQTPKCDNKDPKSCGITVIDDYTSSFHWAETNFSAIWLRSPGWFLLDNSFISDVQNGGLTFVTGGDYSRSSSALGYWAIASNSIFVGATSPNNKYARAAGPPGSMEVGGKVPDGVICDRQYGGYCVSKSDSVGYPLSNWGTGQRLFNIYDGPAYQTANAYLDIGVSECDGASGADKKDCLYYGTPGVRKYLSGTNKDKGYLPNAAIGWKQPNGFYYPPAFHSSDLFFDKVDIRHYVILPIFKPGTYLTDDTRLAELFKGGVEGSRNMMRNFTDIDRQTELNDDDGTLTGFEKTISVNEDGFFGAPAQAFQCKSNKDINPASACAPVKNAPTQATARTSPYDYVTTVVYPGCAMNDEDQASNVLGDKPFTGDNADVACGSTHKGVNVGGNRATKMEFTGGSWSKDCGGPFCYGVPIYRQYLTGSRITDTGKPDGKLTGASTREWLTWFNNKCDPAADGVVKLECDTPFARMAGTGTWQRSIMTVNQGKFYIDTTRSLKTQQEDTTLGSRGSNEEPYVECSVQTDQSKNCRPRSVNVFEAGKTYFVFFVFAKNTTKQMYQIYVGKGFDINTGFKGIKIPATETRYKWTEWKGHPWTTEMVEGSTKGVQDVLQVTVDFSKVTGAELDPKKATSETCKPASFCQGGSGSCDTSLKDNDPRVVMNPNLKNIAKRICSEWAVKDLDCPEGGCLGFSFTLPKSNTPFADDKNHRPPPEPFQKFPTDTSDIWKTLKLKAAASNKNPGDCIYSPDNTPDEAGKCGVPDCALGEKDPPRCTVK